MGGRGGKRSNFHARFSVVSGLRGVGVVGAVEEREEKEAVVLPDTNCK